MQPRQSQDPGFARDAAVKARVPVWGKPQGFVIVDPDATHGAVVGETLYWPDGTLVHEADLRTAAQAPSGVSTTIWRLVMEIPANVKALEYASGTGLFAVTGAGSGAMRSLQAGAGISISNGSGVSGNPTVTNTDTGSAAVASHVAAGDPHPQYALDAHTHALSDLAQSGATSGQVPQWNGSTWIPATVSGGGAAIDDAIVDGVTDRAPSQNAVFDALAGKSATTHGHNLSDLSQSGATSGQVATWNGSAWVPSTPSSGGGAVFDPRDAWLFG